ncbi:DNA repair protein rhp54 [Elysia marginata]|uniref:DNA repair protein rhp54 n=1 Tax=Elysia marginata TaxID=1093978 RepID=A0AAV4EZR7_9GAST|nr:DNA repair protein rhp54 [Elysia marginata]
MAMLWYIVQSTCIDEKEHNFFVRGHSENESDSVHSRISRESKDLSIYTTGQWAATIRNAKHSLPKYQVTEMAQEDFLDFCKIADKFKNVRLDGNKEKVNWLHLKRYAVKKETVNEIRVFTGYKGQGRTIHLTHNLKKSSQELSHHTINLEQAYSAPLAVNRLKITDLISLCASRIIPPAHRSFYEGLQADVDSDD